jgi:hypothetical protein
MVECGLEISAVLMNKDNVQCFKDIIEFDKDIIGQKVTLDDKFVGEIVSTYLDDDGNLCGHILMQGDDLKGLFEHWKALGEVKTWGKT